MSDSSPTRLPAPARRNRLSHLFFSLGETASVLLSSPEGPGPFMRLFFRFPVWLYRIGLGRWMGDHVLILTTTGRKTGRPRLTALSNLGYDQETDTYYVGSGFGRRSDWYRNLLADPRVQVQVGRRRFEGTAEPVPEEVAVRLLSEYLRRYPSLGRVRSKRVGVDFDGSEASLRQLAERVPVIALRAGDSGRET